MSFTLKIVGKPLLKTLLKLDSTAQNVYLGFLHPVMRIFKCHVYIKVYVPNVYKRMNTWYITSTLISM